ncbi:MAG: DUF4397 domain-containing protein [Candidatus Kapabacteria bacterium]|nr:DUF4397 domain-containing protein [Candidatus Kapabacteria bacterium]
MKILHLKLLTFFGFLFFLASCAKENPLLVNPPSPAETVKIRLFNLAGDQKERKLIIGGVNETNLTQYENLSDTIKPTPEDSVTLIVRGVGVEDFRLTDKFRVIRNTNYTIFALESTDKRKPVDTVIILGTTPGLYINPNTSIVSFINTNNDTNVSYSVIMGCPSGTPIAQNITYRTISFQSQLPSGKMPVSLIKHYRDSIRIVGLFELDLKSGDEYGVIIRFKEGKEILYQLDQNDLSKNALAQVPKIENSQSFIRVLNFSTNSINVEKFENEPIVSNLNGLSIGDYKSVSACASTMKDSINIFISNNLKSSLTTSLEVLEKYTLLVFDSKEEKAGLSILAKPIRLYQSLEGKSLIRVVNANYLRDGLTVSLGARNDTNSAGYRSGDVLSSGLAYGEISDYVILPSGRAPITVFSAAAPTRLLKTAIAQFESNKRYLLVIFVDDKGKEQITLVEDNDVIKSIEPLKEGVFTQIINAIPGIGRMNLKIENILNNAVIDYTSSLATVLPNEEIQITVNNTAYQFKPSNFPSSILVATGDENNIDIFDFTERLPAIETNLYHRRFFNACKEIPLVSFRIDSDSGATVADAVKYGTKTDFYAEYNDRKLSFFVIDYQNLKRISKISDVSLTFGKNYSIIFTGDSKKGGYSLIIQQEY